MIEILADIHERASGVAERLRLLGWAVQERLLESGDYVMGGAIVGVERKTTGDFAASLTRGRLFPQLAQLRQTVERPLLIIEGSHAALDRLHPNAVKGALVSINTNALILEPLCVCIICATP